MSLITRIQDLALDMGAELKAVRVKQGDLTTLTTTARTTLVSALNELDANIDALAAAAGAQIDDTLVSSGTKTWSINKIKVEIQAAKDAITNGAGALLDTMAEIAAALGNDANFSATIMNALAKRVRFDAPQTLTAGEKTQAQANMDVPSATAIGNTETNFVTTFQTGLNS